MKFVQGWVDTAGEYNLMANSMSRQGYKPTHLVLHGTAGGSDAYGVCAYMAGENVSTHFVISTDGTIVQGVSCDVAAWGNAPLMSPRLSFDHADVNPNYWTISIEFCKPDTTNQIAITEAQFTSGVALAKLICDEYGIPKHRSDGHAGIVGHCDLNSVERAMCPGTFDWDDFFNALNPSSPKEEDVTIDINTPGVSGFFTATSDGKWQAKSGGNHIGGAILAFYKRYGGDALCGLTYLGLPNTEELVINPPIAGHPEIRVQEFERGCVAYDPSHKLDGPPGAGDTYVLHVGADPRYKSLQNQLAQLQQQPTSQQVSDLNKQIATLQGKLAQIKTIAS